MTHLEMLNTNIEALEATMQRLCARDDYPVDEALKVLELQIIVDSLKADRDALL